MAKIIVIINEGICSEIISDTEHDVMVYDLDRGSTGSLPLWIKHMVSTPEPKIVKKLFEIYEDDCGETPIHKDDPLEAP